MLSCHLISNAGHFMSGALQLGSLRCNISERPHLLFAIQLVSHPLSFYYIRGGYMLLEIAHANLIALLCVIAS